MNSNNILYSNIIKNCNDCIDIVDCKNCDNCYQIIRGENCQKCFFSQNINNCYHCFQCIDCTNCKDCFFCFDLHDKDGYILNKKASKEEVEELKNNINIGKINDYIDKYNKLKNNRFLKSLELKNCENCFGNLLYNSKNCRLYFDSYNNENCNYGMIGDSNSNCHDVTICNPNCEFSYELISAGEEKECIGNIACGNVSKVYYSYLCMYCSDLFGCVGLKNKSYCIFNKQYTKSDYEKLVAKIINKMQETNERGEFLPAKLSPFGYNETVAQEYYPLTREQANKEKYKRQDKNYDPQISTETQTLKGDEIPNIQRIDANGESPDFSGNILDKILICEISNRPFRIVKSELEFYRKHNLSLPHKHPDIRHTERMLMRPPRQLYLKKCDKCGIEMLSIYKPDIKLKVLCEVCHNKEIYG